MDNINFEECLNKLELIVAKMEDKNTSLDDSLALFADGAKLGAQCMDILKNSMGKVEQIIKDIDGLTKVEFAAKE